MPSMVVMSEPCACTANTVQLFTDMPSRSTVQAPQWVVSQPIWVPVSWRFSRGGGTLVPERAACKMVAAGGSPMPEFRTKCHCTRTKCVSLRDPIAGG
jgi:hypothetical protein